MKRVDDPYFMGGHQHGRTFAFSSINTGGLLPALRLYILDKYGFSGVRCCVSPQIYNPALEECPVNKRRVQIQRARNAKWERTSVPEPWKWPPWMLEEADSWQPGAPHA